MICQTATVLRFAPKLTIAIDVICEGRTVCPRRETPGTPNLSNIRLRRCRLGEVSFSLFFVALSRRAPAP